MGIGAPELLILLVLWLALVVGLIWGLYWLIRLAVRHGTIDAQQRLSARGVEALRHLATLE